MTYTDPSGTILMTDAAYYHRVIQDARELAELRDLESMRLWLASRGNPASEDEGHLVYGYILGTLQAKTAELVRWLDRIPEANRG